MDIENFYGSLPPSSSCDDLLPLPWIHCLCGHESLGSAEMLDWSTVKWPTKSCH